MNHNNHEGRPCHQRLITSEAVIGCSVGWGCPKTIINHLNSKSPKGISPDLTSMDCPKNTKSGQIRLGKTLKTKPGTFESRWKVRGDIPIGKNNKKQENINSAGRPTNAKNVGQRIGKFGFQALK